MSHQTTPPNAEFTPTQWSQVDEVIQSWTGKPGALIPTLEGVQQITGYLPEDVQRRVARGLDIPLSQVYGVVTFYSFFTMKPRGRNQIRVCLGTACHVRGAQQSLDWLESHLDLAPGDCTEDRHFGLEIVRCLGACGLAPVISIGADTHRQVKPNRLTEILSSYVTDTDSERKGT